MAANPGFLCGGQNASIAHWLSLGAPADKLLLGFSTYGRTYSLRGSDSSLGALSTGAGEAGPYTRTAGFWSYYEVRAYGRTRCLLSGHFLDALSRGYCQ